MFLLRSAFWLTVGFMVVAPTVGSDVGGIAQAAGTRLADESQQMVVTGLSRIECESLECTIGRALVVGAMQQNASQSSINPMQDAPYAGPAPVPPPRPDWAS